MDFKNSIAKTEMRGAQGRRSFFGQSHPTRLPTESQLAETFGISRLSLREATKALEFLGIVESKTGD
jgi:DNA-binding transcriptional MocR family regulator